MAHLDDLPPDQRAVLGLLLKQGRGYDQIAGMLRLEPRAVRERALDALDALGPQDDALSAEDQDLVADRVLGQADGPAREEAEALLAESPAARAWARTVVAELASLAPAGSLPEIPSDPEPAPEPEPAPAPEATPVPASQPAATPDDAPATTTAAASASTLAPASTSSSVATPTREGAGTTKSRLGTALIVGAALVAIVGIVIALNGGFGGSDSPADTAAAPATTAAATPTTGTGTGTATTARVQQQIELTPPNGGSEALGVAQLVQSGSTRGLAVAAQDLPAGYYAVWLYNSADDAAFLGFAPQVSGSGSTKGQLQGLSQSLPADITKYRRVAVSRQVVTAANREQTPTRPGTIVLRGDLR